jgi:hypothetical protein
MVFFRLAAAAAFLTFFLAAARRVMGLISGIIQLTRSYFLSPPPLRLLTVAHARAFAVFAEVPRFS